jgi:hypothetical protein
MEEVNRHQQSYQISELMSNIEPDSTNEEFLQLAHASADARRHIKYDIDGKLGGEYDENNPPPGKRCRGFLKGNVGIIWENAIGDDSNTTTSGRGYCPDCGYSLYHYSGKACSRVTGRNHPEWRGSPPPSFADANS